MKAVVYHGKTNVSVDEVPDPHLIDPTDAIIKVTSTAICGSDLHLYGGYIPGMEDGDIMGHEFMGEVVELGEKVTHVQVGDRVVVPFNIACGECFFCVRQLYSLCDKTNPSPNRDVVEAMYGQSPAGLFAYTHLFGGYPGGQAQYVRVPYAHVGTFKVPDSLPDEKVLFLTDIFPTGYMAAENCDIEEGDTVAIWGAGPVGQMAAKSARLLGAKDVIVIDRINERLDMAGLESASTTLNFDKEKDIVQILKDLTDGRGPDKCIDAVGLEAHSAGLSGLYDKAKHMTKLETDRPTALRQIINACRKGGTISIPGVYGGVVDKFPLGAAFNKGLQFRMGQTHTHKYIPRLLERIARGEVDPSFVITHTIPLSEAPDAYRVFREKEDNCIKVVMKPWEIATEPTTA
ncbi:MAG TPA: zinc-dependent alcohol dehydrogenase [Candidatus Saccharimonadales bacterium]|nr:zinc-dependent alcohol dehydrogenase [Candidatus Saccharimonadales bacterium]